MSKYKYDRLSAQDTSFLIFEQGNVNMHVASTAIYKAGALATKEGGIDFGAIKKAIGNILHRIPRYRQKIMWIQEHRTACWVDDDQFNLDYHVRHTSLPKPGSEDQLRALASRILERHLDRTKPLWETWLVEGLEGDRFALIQKIHHSMIDGTAGVELSQLLMSPDPTFVPPEPPVYYPRPTPTPAELRKDEYERYFRLPFKALQNFQEFANESQDILGEITIRAKALADTFAQIGGVTATPLNGPLGSHRIINWTSMALSDVKAVRHSLGCTVNDVVLTIFTGAIRQFFINRQVNPAEIDFKVAAPVSVRRENERGKMGNRVSSWIIPIPIGEPDPLRQLETINQVTSELKETNQALAVEMMMGLAEWTPSLLSLGARAGGQSAHTIVTNVPGPQFPLYLIGAEMVEIYPVVPLLDGMGIGVALMSYNGNIFWGFNGDYGKISDIETFVKHINDAFTKLADIAGVTLGADHPVPDKNKPTASIGAKHTRKATKRKSSATRPKSNDTSKRTSEEKQRTAAVASVEEAPQKANESEDSDPSTTAIH
jgi:WS/DGAT/MGAT family acyltransferase